MRLSDEIAKHWFGFPLALRQRWWTETKYGKQEPGDELKETVRKLIEEKENAGKNHDGEDHI
jgi:hypothetical protein